MERFELWLALNGSVLLWALAFVLLVSGALGLAPILAHNAGAMLRHHSTVSMALPMTMLISSVLVAFCAKLRRSKEKKLRKRYDIDDDVWR